MKHYFLTVETRGKGFYNITQQVLNQVHDLPESGLLHLFLQHTSAALTINENADPDVLSDLGRYLETLCPENTPWFEHTTEGADDMPAHIKSSLLSVSLTIPIVSQRLALGTWQGIYLCEFRNRPNHRKVIITVVE